MRKNKNPYGSSFDDEDFLPNLEAQKKFILDTFDFNYVSNVLHKNVYKDPWTGIYGPWKFATIRGHKVPTVNELKEVATELLNATIKSNHPYYYTRRGCFRAVRVENRLILDFVLESGSYD